MKKFILLAIILFNTLFAADFTGFQIMFYVPVSTYNISGFVTSNVGPVANAEIFLYKLPDLVTPTRSVITLADGSYSIIGVPSGSFVLKANSSNFTASYYSAANETITTVSITFDSVSNINYSLVSQFGPDWLDNFSSKISDNIYNVPNNWGGAWYRYSDAGSTVNLQGINDTSLTHKEILYVSYNYNKATKSYVGMGTNLDANATKDTILKPYSAIIFDIKGSGVTVNAALMSSLVTDSDDFIFPVKTTSSWNTVILTLKDFKQKGFGAPKSIYKALSIVNAFHIKNNTTLVSEQGDFSIDNVRFTLEDFVAPVLTDSSLNMKTIFQQELVVSCSIWENNALDYSVIPKLQVTFANGATRNGSIVLYAGELLIVTVSMLATDRQGVATVNLLNVADVSGNILNSFVATFNKIGAGPSGNIIFGVVNSDVGPVANADIFLYQLPDLINPTQSVISLADGSYSFMGVASGSYVVKANSSNFTASYYRIANETLTTVSVTLGSVGSINCSLVSQSGPDWLDNFSSKVSDNISVANNWGGAWYKYSDAVSTLNLLGTNDISLTHKEALFVSYNYNKATKSYVGMGTNLDANATKDTILKPYSAIIFDIKGSGVTVNAALMSSEVTDDDDFVFPVQTTSSWNTVVLTLNAFKQKGFGAPKSIYKALSKVKAFHIKNNTTLVNEQGEFSLDNLRFTREDFVAPVLTDSSLNKKTLFQQTLVVSCSIWENNALDYSVMPKVQVTFANGAIRTGNVVSYAGESLIVTVSMLATDRQGVATVNLLNVVDVSGNELNCFVSTFNKIGVDPSGNILNIFPVISRLAVNSQYLALNQTVSLDVRISNNIPYIVDNSVIPTIRFNYANGQHDDVLGYYSATNNLQYLGAISANEGLVTVDTIGVYNGMELQDFLAVVTLNYDFTAPVVTMNIPDTTFVQSFPLELSSNEAVSIVISVNEVRVLGTSIYGAYNTIITLNAGINTINATFRDLAGNTSVLSKVMNVATKVVTASFGSSSTDVVEVRLTPGAYGQDVSITVNLVTSDVMPSNATINGQMYDIKLVNSSGNIITTVNFAQPVLIKLPYNGTSTTQVSVKYLDTTVSPSVWKYDGVSIVSVDVVNHYIVFSVSHLTVFAVFSYSDSYAPAIAWVKSNSRVIRSGINIDALPVFSINASEINSGDSGIATWSVTLIKSDMSFSKVVSGSFNNVPTATLTMDLSTGNALSAGDYTLTTVISDGANNVTTNSLVLHIATGLNIAKFLGGPNPVNINVDTVHFTYELTKSAPTTIKVFDVAGHKVKEIKSDVGNNGAVIGKNDVSWNGMADNGGKVATGLYFAYLIADDGSNKATGKFMLLVVK